MPHEVITSLPNANLAERWECERDPRAKKAREIREVRSTEPRLTNTTVDGVNLPPKSPVSARSNSTPFHRAW